MDKWLFLLLREYRQRFPQRVYHEKLRILEMEDTQNKQNTFQIPLQIFQQILVPGGTQKNGRPFVFFMAMIRRQKYLISERLFLEKK